jgi:hypothetical protein
VNNFISKAALEARRARYKKGTRVELVAMTDPYTKLKPGDLGTVDFVDDTGTAFIIWDSGSHLGAVYGEDEIRLLPAAMPDEVREQIFKLRTLPDCPNMFDLGAVQRLAFDNDMYALVEFIETDRKAYATFILTGEDS